ncbi:MAG: hypothetical protein WC718_16090 [Phycisphaerales bacterium]|jgi:aldose 1-epimerase
MSSVVIQSDSLRLEVRQDVGAGVSDFSVRVGGRWQALWRRAAGCDNAPADMACTVLAPWTNRIASGKFEFGGRLWNLPTRGPGHTADYGIVKDLAWTVLDRGPDSVRLEREVGAGEAGWPWAFRARVRYEVMREELRAELEVMSRSNAPMPVGFGFAPVWLRHLGAYDDDVSIDVGMGESVDANTERDECLVSRAGAGEICWRRSGVAASWTCSPEFSHVVVRTPGVRGADGVRSMASVFEVQPVTMAGAGFEMLAHAEAAGGLAVLQSGETMRGIWSVRVQRMGE